MKKFKDYLILKEGKKLPSYSGDDIVDAINKDRKLSGYFKDYIIVSNAENSDGDFNISIKLEDFQPYDGSVPYEFMSNLGKWLNKNKKKYDILEHNITSMNGVVLIDLTILGV